MHIFIVLKYRLYNLSKVLSVSFYLAHSCPLIITLFCFDYLGLAGRDLL